MPLDNKNKSSILYFLLLIFIILLIRGLFFGEQIEKLSYSKFRAIATQNYRIEECFLSTTHIHGTYIKDINIWKKVLKEKATKKKLKKTEKKKKEKVGLFARLRAKKLPGRVKFVTIRVHRDNDLVNILQKHHVKYKGKLDTNWATALSWLLPLIILVAFWVFLMRRMNNYGKDVMSFVKTRAKIRAEEDTKTTFEDVAGCDEAKEELSEIVEFLKSPEKFEQLGGKIPKGALLVGPPGTGKTLLSRAVAGEAGVPFFNISGSEFVEMFVGVGASRVRDLFQQAKAKHPCIIFIDEIDAVGRHRGAGHGGGHDEREQTLNQLLAEMDGFETNKGIIVLAATNRPDILDPALMRPGRFDRRVTIDQPDIRGREEILKIHAKEKPLAKEVNLKRLAQRTPGFSGADLANVMNEAALLAARKSRDEIAQEDINEAVERVMAGPERKSRIISPKEKKITAYHEVGHALLAELLPHGDPVHKVSIIPRGSALGYTLSMPDEDKYLRTREELLAKICVFLGGRVAEEVALGIISTGAQNDFEHVTDMARSIVSRFGMSKKLGPMAFERPQDHIFMGRGGSNTYFSGRTMDQVDQEVKKTVWECYELTFGLLTKNKRILEEISQLLLLRETVEGVEFREILEKLQKGEDISSHKEVITEEANKKKQETDSDEVDDALEDASEKGDGEQDKEDVLSSEDENEAIEKKESE